MPKCESRHTTVADRIRTQCEGHGVGLMNVGASCFINAVLQILTHTTPLVVFLRHEAQGHQCKNGKMCILCLLRRHMKRAWTCTDSAIMPEWVGRNANSNHLNGAVSRFSGYNQEDAHEFLRFMLDGLHDACRKLQWPRFAQNTASAVQRIFGGRFQSKVHCRNCNEHSLTFDDFMDLNLEISGAWSLEDALRNYTKPEALDRENAYQCERCHKKVSAEKTLTINVAPVVLTIQLKRFCFYTGVSKLNSSVRYPLRLNFSPFMSDPQAAPEIYELYGVVSHIGDVTDGHYIAHVKEKCGDWYKMDDIQVFPVSAKKVLDERSRAYLLHYVKVADDNLPCRTVMCTSSSSFGVESRINGAVTRHCPGNGHVPVGSSSLYSRPGNHCGIRRFNQASRHESRNGSTDSIVKKHPSCNGAAVKWAASTAMNSNGVATGSCRNKLSNGNRSYVQGPKPSLTVHASTSVVKDQSSGTALPQNRKKISFEIPKVMQPVQSAGKDDRMEDQRISMKICEGSSNSVEKSAHLDHEESLKPSQRGSLVPYAEDSDETSGEIQSKNGENMPREESPTLIKSDCLQNKDSVKGSPVLLSSKNLFEGNGEVECNRSIAAAGRSDMERTCYENGCTDNERATTETSDGRNKSMTNLYPCPSPSMDTENQEHISADQKLSKGESPLKRKKSEGTPSSPEGNGDTMKRPKRVLFFPEQDLKPESVNDKDGDSPDGQNGIHKQCKSASSELYHQHNGFDYSLPCSEVTISQGVRTQQIESNNQNNSDTKKAETKKRHGNRKKNKKKKKNREKVREENHGSQSSDSEYMWEEKTKESMELEARHLSNSEKKGETAYRNHSDSSHLPVVQSGSDFNHERSRLDRESSSEDNSGDWQQVKSKKTRRREVEAERFSNSHRRNYRFYEKDRERDSNGLYYHHHKRSYDSHRYNYYNGSSEYSRKPRSSSHYERDGGSRYYDRDSYHSASNRRQPHSAQYSHGHHHQRTEWGNRY